MAINLRDEKVPNGWQDCTLPDFTRIVMGQSPSSDTYNYEGNGLPFFQGKAEFGDIYPRIDKYCSKPNKIAKAGATLLSVRAPVGPTNLANLDYCIGRGLAAIHPYCDIDPKFILFLFRSIEPDISGKGTGSTFKAVTKAFVEELQFALPPLYEQHRIVAKTEELLSELDKGIESLKTAREQLKVYRQAVLKHAFEGKLTTQWREENKDRLKQWTSVSVKNHRHENQLPDSFSIPDCWVWSRVSDLLLEGPANGRSVKDRVDGFPVLRLTALKDGRIDLAEYKRGDWNREDALQFIVQSDDFLLSRGNGSKHLVGRGGVVPVHQDEIAFPDTMVRLRINPQTMHVDFFSRLWESRLVRSQIELAARTTAGIYKINQGHIKGFRVPVPGLDEQDVIVGLLDEKLSIVEELERDLGIRLTASEILRQSILKKAFSGQLVEQDPNDEPASVLLERIKTEKAKQAKPGKIKKRKTAA